MYKNIKHASSEKVELINEINDIKFSEEIEYFLIAKKEELYVIVNKQHMNLIVDSTIIKMLSKEGKIGGLK